MVLESNIRDTKAHCLLHNGTRDDGTNKCERSVSNVRLTDEYFAVFPQIC